MENICIAKEQYLELRRHNIQQKGERQIFRHKIRSTLPYDFVGKAFSSSHQFTQPLTQGELIVEIEILEKIQNIPISATGLMKLKAADGNHFLKEIWETYPGKVFMSWKVEGFGDLCIPENGKYGPSNWRTEGIELNRAPEIKMDSNGNILSQVYQSMKEIPVRPSMINMWSKSETLRGFISVFLDIKKSPYQLAIEEEHFSKMQRILESKINTDLTLVTQDEKAPVKCHRVILSMGSGKLGNLLKMNEGSTIDIMKHHSAECVEAFVAFLYHLDTTKLFESTYTALDVLEVALDFQVLEIISRVYNFINAKPNSEILACHTIKLFGIVKAHQLKLNNDGAGEGNQDDESANNSKDDGHKSNDCVDESENNEPVGLDFSKFVENQTDREKRNVESDDDEDLNVKRMCYRSGDGLSSNPANPTSPTRANESDDSDREDNVDVTASGSTNDHTMDDINHGIYKTYLDLLEIRAVALIKWLLAENRVVAMMDAIQGNRLLRRPEIHQALSSVLSKYCEGT